MQLGVFMMAIGLGWFVLRKRIAQRQADIVEGLLRRSAPFSDEQVKALEVIGLMFCSLLFGAGLTIVLLHALLG